MCISTGTLIVVMFGMLVIAIIGVHFVIGNEEE
jgi:hypothetical protein